MHYHVVEDQTKATHQRIPIDHQWFFFFIFFMFSQVQSVLHQLMTSVHAQLTYRLLSGLSSTDQLCSRALLAYLVPVSITINISLLDWIGRIEYLLPALASLGSASISTIAPSMASWFYFLEALATKSIFLNNLNTPPILVLNTRFILHVKINST